MKREIWKDIKDYEGYYQVSNLGRVKSLNREIIYSNGKKYNYLGKILSANQNKFGYIYYSLSINRKMKTFYLHRLIAEAFISNPESKPCVNHIDGNKSNNNVNNLEWVTQSENEKHAHKIGLKSQNGEKNHQHRLTNENVLKLFQLSWEEKLKQSELASLFNVKIGTVQSIKYKKRWKRLLENM